MEQFINILVERAISLDLEKMNEFVDAVHANVILPGFDEALFARLYSMATADRRTAAAQILRQQ